MQPMQSLEFYFKSSEYPKSSKIQTKCFVTKTVKLIKGKPEAEWFTSHPQFRHFFHMPDEDNLKIQGMWMLLLRNICTPEDDVAWFAVSGVPIRYSMSEHALISGLDCGDYPPNYENLGGYKFVDYYFHDRKKITISDVKQKMLSMLPCPDRLKITGRLTFKDAIKEIKHVMNHLKGEVKEACVFPSFIIPLEVINSVLVPTIGEQIMLARIIDEEREYDRQGIPNSRLQGLKERILEFMGEGFVGLHVTVETKLKSPGSRMSDIEKNQRLLRRRAKKIEDRLTSIEKKDKSNVEQEAGKEKNNIENTEQEAERKNENSDEEETEEKEADDNAQQEGEKEKENIEADEQDKEDSESESETDELKQLKERSRAQADKLWKEIEADEEEIGGKHDEEEGEEKEAETSEEEKENSDDDKKVEEKVVESEAEGKDDQAEVEGKESETREQENEKSETDEVESEVREAKIEKGTLTPPRGNQTEGTPKDDHNEPRVETNRTDETPTPPRGNQMEGTPTPPRGRTKAMAARRLVTKHMEEKPGKCEKIGEIVEEYAEEEKQRWIMVGYKEAPSPWIMYRCKENADVVIPKKNGRPKRKSQFGKLSLQMLLCPKMSKMDN
ncbi:PREDICTED: uncharacterized protein At3g43530-like [Brassica oleracea var. oleracea]|uniref:uncharacterized protein At3g43530-like n=1 Tax=Brassica oleracea var. oleracea TaxID=109376 RepID=UPI0006A6FDB3|nr:PREDICTED: uncharacterized protein At3g43530-like [Brassica oleracea var. oleracea]